MSYTAPPVVIAGAIYTASEHNTFSVANIIALRATPSNCAAAYHSTTQTVTAGNTTELNLDSEDLDTSTMHDTVTNNNRITIPTGGDGRYLCFGHTSQASANGTLHLRKNGSNIRSATAASSLPSLTVIGYLALVATDWISLAGQAGGSNVDFGSATKSLATWLNVVGPLPPA